MKQAAPRRSESAWLSRTRAGAARRLVQRPAREKTRAFSIIERVLQLRAGLAGQGLDAGPATIAWHLEQDRLRPPSIATIHRILRRAELITPQPRKRPRSSYIRFQAPQPNHTWQSDFTHWRLADNTGVEILNWLDDHSRFLLSCTAHAAVSGDDVVTTFLTAVEEHGAPASTLTDNGRVFTTRFGGGRNAFEHLLHLLGITQKNGSPGHPQTQGKVERFHQTLKRWLHARPPARTIAELQQQLDTFRTYYNQQRPHRAIGRTTPLAAYQATQKARPANTSQPATFRLRYDRIDKTGRITLRHAGRLHHLAIGITHAGTRVLALIDHSTVTITRLDTGEIIAVNTIEPGRNYWRNTLKPAGRWP